MSDERKKRAEQYIDTHGHLMMWDLLESYAALEVETDRKDLASILSDECSQHTDKATEDCPACRIRERFFGSK